ncbi:MAG: 23S rRNA (guanosine(2251)-2'-O)-methyltransferase RlmB [Cellulomonas sp.]|uniref:23S rRNA (guanosine(2251)-2'-O)-methyltransferase RlmB n=1 Tax=Cellulomonas sp. TaxID=40001 RepID=UPI00184CDD08|nr:23S rRNA (guanosine(2251)-2'-O)-methyltransferase RlmB [Cellulomonas sp.]NMM18219.1 23S rRNA (guanosine(2251)-2'-O)-methyltransferase RlmB [Cellulomonas sp.]NMM31420.1 23S rRNA (guanosine(2251)-2'-O)-methyltransferase RlmB [Cellulomonas sp.]
MTGNSQRRGATRKPGSKKGPSGGTGGKGRQALEGRGPTPKAEERPYHVAAKRKLANEKLGATSPGRAGGPVRRMGAPTGRVPGAGAPRSASRGAAGTRGGKGVSATHEIVSGRNSVVEALRAGIPVTTVYIATRIEADDRTREILQAVVGRGYPLLEVSKPELDRLTDGSVHQGVAIQVPPYEYRDSDDLLDAAAASGRPPLIVALDGVTDPRNLGAVLRSSGAFGVHGVVVPERRSAGVTAAAWKVSAGAAARIPVARVTNLVRALQAYREAGCYIVGLDGGGDTPIGDLPYAADPLVIVVGSEGKGLSRLVRENCDAIASIPISAAMESLNAGVAAGIALYEIARQRAASAAQA